MSEEFDATGIAPIPDYDNVIGQVTIVIIPYPCGWSPPPSLQVQILDGTGGRNWEREERDG